MSEENLFQHHQQIAKLESDLRLAKLRGQEASKTIGQLQRAIFIANHLIVLAIQHNHSDQELEGEMNLIHYVLEAEVERFTDDEIPF